MKLGGATAEWRLVLEAQANRKRGLVLAEQAADAVGGESCDRLAEGCRSVGQKKIINFELPLPLGPASGGDANVGLAAGADTNEGDVSLVEGPFPFVG